MIFKNNKIVSAIFKGTKEIIKRYKGTQLIYEAFKKLIKSGVLPFTLLGCKGEKRILPSQYRQLDYLQGTGTQYIDLGFNDTVNTKVVLDLTYTGVNNTGVACYMGSNGGNLIAVNKDNLFSIGGFASTITPIVGEHYHIQLRRDEEDMRKLIINDSEEFTGSKASLNNPVFLFALGGSPTSGRMLAKVHYCQIYNNNKLVRDVVPCYDTINQTYGMYDFITGNFYTNKGTDTLVGGPVTSLPQTYQALEYIESTGTQYIDTGFIPTRTTKIEDVVSHMVSSSTATLFGASGAESNRFQCYHGNTNDPRIVARMFSQAAYVSITVTNFTKKYTIIMDTIDRIFEVKEVGKKTLTDGQGELFNYSIALFGNNMMGTIATQSAHRRYSFKIWDAGVLKRDMIPCYHKIDKSIGMYDLVEGKFYTNMGTGVFLRGAEFTLPDEYQQVEYIQNEGGQYIDTGVLASNLNSFEVKAQLIHTNNASQTIWGGRDSATAYQLYGNQLSCVKSISGYQFICGAAASTTTDNYDNKIHIYKTDPTTLYIDGTPTLTMAGEAFTEKDSVCLFATNTSGTVSFNGGSLKMYYCKIWKEDILIRSYIPCYNKETGIIGMYDLVQGIFYENAGTDTFLKGRDVTFYSSNTLLDYKIYGNKQEISKNTRLPLDYEEVTYIEATGTQYFSIDYVATDKTNSKGVYQITDTSKATMLFGSRQGANANAYSFNWGGGQPYKYYNCYYENGQGGITNVTIDGGKHNFEKQGAKMYLDGELVSDRTNNSYVKVPFTTPYNMVIFGCNTNSNIGLLTYAKIFELQFYDEDELKVNLVPCYRKSDGVIGMYDLITDVFYTNEGTGTFIKGIEVTKKASPDDPQEFFAVGDKTKNEFNPKAFAKAMDSYWTDYKDYYYFKTNGAYNTKMNFAGEENTQYVLSFKYKMTKGAYVFSTYYSDGTKVNHKVTSSTDWAVGTIVTSAGATLIGIGGSGSQATENLYLKEIQLEKGTTATSYVPFGYKIPVKIKGKNYIPFPYFMTETTHNGVTFKMNKDGSITANGTATGGSAYIAIYRAGDNPLPPGKYCLSGAPTADTYLMFSANIASCNSGKSTPFTITEGQTQNALTCCVYENHTVDNVVFKPMIELGDTATEFEVYKPEYTVDIYLEEPLRKSEDFTDYLDFANKRVVRELCYHTFDGTELWEQHTETSTGIVCRNEGLLTPKIGAPSSSTFMTHFALTEVYSTASFEPGWYRFAYDTATHKITSSRVYISTDLDTVEEFQAWMAQNRPSIVYPLEEPRVDGNLDLPEIPIYQGGNTIKITTQTQPSCVEVTYYGRD